MIIRPVLLTDAPQVLGIYAPFIANSSVSFELEVPSLKQFEERIASYTEKYPWLVAEEDGKVLGYAYASAYRERKAYQWSCECSVYVHPSYVRRGIAAKLYTELLNTLALQGFRNVFAVITLPNEASEKFHASFGFEHLGIFRKVGYKFAQWHDVLWMVKTIPQNSIVQEPVWMKDFKTV